MKYDTLVLNSPFILPCLRNQNTLGKGVVIIKHCYFFVILDCQNRETTTEPFVYLNGDMCPTGGGVN